MRLLTLARDLRRRRARERQGLFVAEGVRAVEAALDAARDGRAEVRGALVAPGLGATDRGRGLRARLDALGVPVLLVDERDFATAADTDAPQGVLLVAAQPAAAAALADHPALADDGRELRLLVLDAVQDPGNVGTLVRAAAGLGAAAVVALPGTADVWSAKVVRAAMGAHFAVPTLPATTAALAAFLAGTGTALWGADGDGRPVAAAAPDAPARLALAVGNEGAGLTAAVRQLAAALVAVPSTGRVESFNAAVAGSILLYELRPAALRLDPPGAPR